MVMAALNARSAIEEGYFKKEIELGDLSWI